jgi:hypothetical protein
MQTSKESVAEITGTQSPPSQFPGLDALRVGLNSALTGNGHDRGPVDVLAREAARWSTHPSEIVTCQLGDGTKLKLHCKYPSSLTLESHGHRSGVPYEAEVYRHVLQPIGMSTPQLYGAYKAPAGDTWLFVQHVDDGRRMGKGPRPQTHLRAAEWLGRFHAINETRLSSSALSFLNRYDADYYLGWVRRTSEFAGDLHKRFSWLRLLCDRADDFVALLLSAPLTVIHGEFYGGNVIYRHGMIHPVDWESAAIAAGEIDLASITEGESEEIIRICNDEYQITRWPKPATPDFERTFAAAQLYLTFRWMGDRPEWTTDADNCYYFEEMRSLGERLGLI